MELEDITLENYFEKVSYSSATPEQQEGKIVISNGSFIQNIIQFKLINKLEQLRLALR